MNNIDIKQGKPENWLALMIGNSHLHWAWFENGTFRQSWDTPHLSAEVVDCLIQHQFDFKHCCTSTNDTKGRTLSSVLDRLAPSLPLLSSPPLWIASVVPAQSCLWKGYTGTHWLSLKDIPLQGVYSTLGIDRALAVAGVASTLKLPALVIDAGTALTFTGADAEGRLVGGAILPGLGLQLRSLTEHTAALPELSERLDRLRSLQSIETALPRWATNTPEAMLSGVIYTLLAGLNDFVQTWLQSYSESAIAITGGDSNLLLRCWQQQYPEQVRTMNIKADANLVFWGMQAAISGGVHSVF